MFNLKESVFYSNWIFEIEEVEKNFTSFSELKKDLENEGFDTKTFNELLDGGESDYVCMILDMEDSSDLDTDELRSVLSTEQLNYIAFYNSELARNWNFENEKIALDWFCNFSLPMNNYPSIFSLNELNQAKSFFKVKNSNSLHKIINNNKTLVQSIFSMVKSAEGIENFNLNILPISHDDLMRKYDDSKVTFALSFVFSTEDLKMVEIQKKSVTSKRIQVIPLAGNNILVYDVKAGELEVIDIKRLQEYINDYISSPLKEDFKNLLQQEFDLPKMLSGDVLELVNEAKEQGIDLAKYIGPEHQLIQVIEVLTGLQHKVDVSKYNNPKLSYKQMQEVRLGLEDNIDLTFFDVIPYSNGELREIRLALKNNVDKSKVEKHMIGLHNMRELQKIRKSLEQGLLENISSSSSLSDLIDDILESEFNFDVLSKGNYETTLEMPAGDYLTTTQIKEIMMYGKDRFIDIVAGMYNSAEEDYYIMETVLAKLKESDIEFDDYEVIEMIHNKVTIKYPFEDYNQEIEVALLFATDRDKESDFNLIPTSEDLAEGSDTFKSGSIISAVAKTDGISLMDLNNLRPNQPPDANKALLHQIYLAYFEDEVDEIYIRMSLFATTCRIKLLDAVNIKHTKECKFVKLRKPKFVISDRYFDSHSKVIELNKNISFPINWLYDVKYLEYDVETVKGILCNDVTII